MALIKYVGGLGKVRAPWNLSLEVKRGAPVEAPDADAATLTGEPAAPWVYVGEATFSGKVGGQDIEFTPSPSLEVNIPAEPVEE
jgi:hypothetical protein